MDIDTGTANAKPQVSNNDSDRDSTPEKSDLDATEDEDDEDLDAVPASQPKQNSRGVGSKGKVIENVREKEREEKKEEEEVKDPPPRRELPFQRQTAVGTRGSQSATAEAGAKVDTQTRDSRVVDDDETTDEDDEL